MKKKTLLAPSLFLSGILLFSGCGSSATTSAVHQNKSADSWAVEASEPLDDSGFSYDGEADMMDDTATAETAGSSSDSSVSDAATDAAEATHDQSTRKLIRTVSMDIATEDLDTLRTKLDNSITSCGGYIESSTLDTPQNGYSRRSYYVTARIPSDNLDSFLETAGTLGTVTNKNIETEDITLRYVDQKAYLDSLRTEYDRVSELLEQATPGPRIQALRPALPDQQLRNPASNLRQPGRLQHCLLKRQRSSLRTTYLQHYRQPHQQRLSKQPLRSPRFLRRPLRSHHRQPPGSGGPDRHHHRCHPVDTKTDPQTQNKKREHRHSSHSSLNRSRRRRYKQRCKNNVKNRKQVIPDSSTQKLLPPIKSQRRSLIEHRWQLFIHSLTVFPSNHILRTRHFPSGCRKHFTLIFFPPALNAQRQTPVPWGVDNTLWALRASFEIRHLRRLSRGSADPREYSRS